MSWNKRIQMLRFDSPCDEDTKILCEDRIRYYCIYSNREMGMPEWDVESFKWLSDHEVEMILTPHKETNDG